MKELLAKFHFSNFLAFIIVIFIMIYWFYISSSAFPTAMVKEISDIKIATITIMTGIISFYFGSSQSKKKEEQKLNNEKE